MDSKPARIYEPLIVTAALDPDAVKICRRLKRYGHEAYLVGGCVRDLSLGHIPKDFDVATSARPRQIKRLFRNARIIGRRFKLVHIQFGDKIIEVSTFRKTPSVDAESALESAEVEVTDRDDEADIDDRSESDAPSPRDVDTDAELESSDDVGASGETDSREDDEPSMRTAHHRDRERPRNERDPRPTHVRDEGPRHREGRREEPRHGADERRDHRHRDGRNDRGERRFPEDRGRGRSEHPREDRGPRDPRHHDVRGDRGPRHGDRDREEHRGRRPPRHELDRSPRSDDSSRDSRRESRGGFRGEPYGRDRDREERRPDRGPARRGDDDRRPRDDHHAPSRYGREPHRDPRSAYDRDRIDERDRNRRDDRGARDQRDARRNDDSHRDRADRESPRDDRRWEERPDRRGSRGEDRFERDRGMDSAPESRRSVPSDRYPDDDARDEESDQGNDRYDDRPMARGGRDRHEDAPRDYPDDEVDAQDPEVGSMDRDRDPDADGNVEPDPDESTSSRRSGRRRGGRGRRGRRGPGGSSREQRSRRDRIHRSPDDEGRSDEETRSEDSSGEDDPIEDQGIHGADLADTAGRRGPEENDPYEGDDAGAPDLRDDGEEGDEDEDGSGDLLIRRDNVFGTAEEDAVRRDFTINALFYDVDENVVLDYVGGADDLARRMIRTIGDPEIRFQEDPVRILRAIKFAARLNFVFDDATYAALVKYRGDLRKCAAPRLTEELLKILSCGAAARAFDLMRSTGVLETILPEIHDYIERNPAPSSTATRDDAEPRSLRDDETRSRHDDEPVGRSSSDDPDDLEIDPENVAPESSEREPSDADDELEESIAAVDSSNSAAPIVHRDAAETIRRYLEVIDEADRGRRVFGNATLFCALLLGPIREAIGSHDGPRDPGMAADKVMRPFSQRMAISRRDAFRVKQIVVALPRFRHQKNSRRRRRVKPIDLVKRDYFKDSLDFYRIECAVRGINDDREIRRWLDLYYGWLRNANPREWRRIRTEAPFQDFGPSVDRPTANSDATPARSEGFDGAQSGRADGSEARFDREGGRRRRRRGRGRHRDGESFEARQTPSDDTADPASPVGDAPTEPANDADPIEPDREARGVDVGDDSSPGEREDARGRRRRRGRGRGRSEHEDGKPSGEREDDLDTSDDDDPVVEIDWNAPFPTVDDPGPISMIRTGVDQTEKRSRRRRRRLDGAARELSKEVEDQPALQALKMIEGDPRGHEATRPRKPKRKDDDRARNDREPPFDFVADFESIEDVFRW